MNTEKRWRKFNKQSCFLEKIDEIDKSLDRLTKKKSRRHKLQNYNIWNESITISPANIKRIIREYYRQLYTHNFYNFN